MTPPAPSPTDRAETDAAARRLEHRDALLMARLLEVGVDAARIARFREALDGMVQLAGPASSAGQAAADRLQALREALAGIQAALARPTDDDPDDLRFRVAAVLLDEIRAAEVSP